MEGTSFAYALTGDGAKAPDQKTTQYFEMMGNRGIYHGGWMASVFHSAASLRSAATKIIERSSESPSRQTKTMCCFPEAKKLATEERHHTSSRGV